MLRTQEPLLAYPWSSFVYYLASGNFLEQLSLQRLAAQKPAAPQSAHGSFVSGFCPSSLHPLLERNKQYSGKACQRSAGRCTPILKSSKWPSGLEPRPL
jgi:hypothetical protein